MQPTGSRLKRVLIRLIDSPSKIIPWAIARVKSDSHPNRVDGSRGDFFRGPREADRAHHESTSKMMD